MCTSLYSKRFFSIRKKVNLFTSHWYRRPNSSTTGNSTERREAQDTHTDIFKIRKIYFSFQKKKGGALQALVAFSSGLEGKLCDVIRRRPLLLEKKRQGHQMYPTTRLLYSFLCCCVFSISNCFYGKGIIRAHQGISNLIK